MYVVIILLSLDGLTRALEPVSSLFITTPVRRRVGIPYTRTPTYSPAAV